MTNIVQPSSPVVPDHLPVREGEEPGRRNRSRT